MTVPPSDRSSLWQPPRPQRPSRPLRGVALLRASRRDLLSIWPQSAFKKKTISLTTLGRQIFICNSPDSVHEALVVQAANFSRKNAQTRNALRPAIGDGLFISDGALWKRRRRLVAPLIHGSRMPVFAPIIAAAASEMATSWEATPGVQIDMLSAMGRLTADILCRSVFGRSLGEHNAVEIVGGFSAYQQDISSLDVLSLAGVPQWVPRVQARSVRRAAARIRGALARIVADCRNHAGERAAVVDLLLEAHDEDSSARLSDGDIADEAAVLFLAGHETTASTLAWCWYLLSQSPEIEARLHAELDAQLGGHVATHDDLARLPFTTAIVRETLRLYPPVPIFARETAADTMIGDEPVRKGAMLFVVPWLLHRHRGYWPEPDAFMPDRFLAPATPIQRGLYIPFGIGPRVCAGATFGMSEVVLCLATLAGRVRPRLPSGTMVLPNGRLTIRPAQELAMQIEARG